MKNRYRQRSRISEAKFRQLARLFCDDLNAVQIAATTHLNRKTVNRILLQIRCQIALACESGSPLKGAVEIDESYSRPRRVRGKKGRGAGKKIVVFGVLKRQGKVYTQIVPNASRAVLKGVIEARIDPDSTVYSDGWPAYDGLIDWGYKKHYRINHSKDQFAAGHRHINGIESFWGVAKVRLSGLRGIRQQYFYLHLKECEWRYNMRHKDMYQELLKLMRGEHKIDS